MSVERKEQEQPLARAYHFTNVDNLFDIEHGSNMLVFEEENRITVNQPGLYPKTTFGDDDFLFCFLNDPHPVEWRRYPALYQALLGKIGDRKRLHLFSFDVFESDNPFVVDFAPAIPFFNNGSFRQGGAADFQSYFRYLETMVPLKDYHGGYQLPELLISRPIAYERLISVPLPPV